MRLIANDRIVIRAAPYARLRAPTIVALVLEIRAEMRMLRRLRPAALVQANDAQTSLGQHQTMDSAARTGTDDDDIGMIGLPHRTGSRSNWLISIGRTASVAIQQPR